MKLIGSRKAVRTPEFHKKKELQRKFRFVGIFIVILAVLVSPFFILRSKSLLIKKILIQGNNVTQSSEIEAIVKKSLTGNLLLFLPKASSLLVSKNKIEKDLLDTIPRIASVNASVSDPETLNIEVIERSASALYCSDTSNLNNPSKCYFLDPTGYIYSEAPVFSGGVYRVYTNTKSIENPLQTQFLSQEEYKAIDVFQKNLEELNFKPRVVVKKGDEYGLVLVGGAEVRWKSSQNLVNLAADLKSFLRDSKIKVADFDKLLYIDLRFENKVFYKFRSE